MKSLFYVIISSAVMLSMRPLYSSGTLEVQPSVDKGRYYESDIITPAKLAYLPIPITKEDYSFLQSIDTHTCIVLGNFSSGDRSIALITDKDSDGKVDDVTTYLLDQDRFIKSPEPRKEYSDEKFAEMKRRIIEGVRGDLNPNPEGSAYIKKIISENSSLIKTVKIKNGYKVYINDAEKQSLHRAMFYFADNSICGSDLVFEVLYQNIGKISRSPAIKFSVYCKESKDNTIREAAKNLSEYTALRYTGIK